MARPFVLGRTGRRLKETSLRELEPLHLCGRPGIGRVAVPLESIWSMPRRTTFGTRSGHRHRSAKEQERKEVITSEFSG